MYLKWAPISYYCHKTPFENSHTRQTCRKIAALDYFCRLEHKILFSGRAASEHVRKSLLLYIQFVWVLWIGTKLDLTCLCQKMSSWVTDYFFIQFYVRAIFHNDWTREMNEMKRKTLYNFNSLHYFSMRFYTLHFYTSFTFSTLQEMKG